MKNPFEKIAGERELSAEKNEVVDTSFENLGEYFEAYGIDESGNEIPDTRKRLESNPADEDGEKIKREYKEFRRGFNLDKK